MALVSTNNNNNMSVHESSSRNKNAHNNQKHMAATATATTKRRMKRLKKSVSSVSYKSSTGSVASTHTHDSSDFKSCGFAPLVTSSVMLAMEHFDDMLDNIPTTNNKNKNNHIMSVNRNELHRISLLGSGACSNVYLVVVADYEKNDIQKLALKCLDPLRLQGPDDFLSAATDLAMEASTLSQLEPHENIIRLAEFVPRDFPSRLHLDLSKLYGRIETCAIGIASGMAHLHKSGIVMRDLKPSNVGFDESGIVRIFDFGMARSVQNCNPDEMCGSARYMSPEAMAGHGYSLKSDVYSFGILLFELCTLQVPFEDDLPKNATLQDFQKLVVEEGLRPSSKVLERIPCAKTRSLIQRCWHTDPNSRPSFEEILQTLKHIVQQQQEQ
eukprot:CAMPEP_0178888222 /NCGR_PEP_ID=MMETSP0747-20121128/17053_1 /TAXON_ID=913974 /ORGANISM="Nitzschia punctata, Strain CCMP561" /LENGTH=383 /DNA_ID=CAMNT_0020557511 /DNA_START=49 /DNA_END=1201 /DNA_ORIENTATION=+